MTNVPRNVLKPPPQNRGGSNKSLMLVTPDPFPSPAHIKKKVKGVARQTSARQGPSKSTSHRHLYKKFYSCIDPDSLRRSTPVREDHPGG